MAQINLENLPEVINNKMDRDGLNASATFDCVIETYGPDNSGNWYRLYKSGWVEQGGFYSNSSGHSQNFVFLKPFKDTNYLLFTGSTYTSNGGTDHQESMSEVPTRSTTGFTKYIWGTTNLLWWEAKGWGA